MTTRKPKPRTPADLVEAAAGELVVPRDRLEELVEGAYFEGMLAACDEFESSCGAWTRAREWIRQVRKLVEGRRNGCPAAKGGGRWTGP